MSIATTFYILGWMIGAFGIIMFLPAAVSYIAGGTAGFSFILSAIVSIFLGGVLIMMNRTSRLTLQHRDAFLLTFMTWTMLSFVAALPMYFSGVAPTFIDALFESVSGLTTTGASVLSGLDTMDKGVLLWRSLLQWLGGMGVIVLATAVIPFLGVGGMQLYKAEMPGVVKDKLQPRLKETAELLWIVYLILTLTCGFAYFMAGMTAFDAICHAFTTVATGGYSTHDASFAYFDSPAIERIAVVFMILGAVNFSLHFMALSKRSLRSYVMDTEFRTFIFILVLAILVMTYKLVASDVYANGHDAFRYALFNATAIMTTTGYASADYAAWPVMVPMMALVLMFFGGCSGSTAGGMKIMRIILVSRLGWREIQKTIYPRAVIPLKMMGRVVPTQVLQAVWSFVGLYIICFVFFTWVMTLFGLDLVTSFSAAAATITGLGPALGEIGPTSNYSAIPEGAKALLCFSMLLGRLELFTLLIILTPQFWRR